MEKKILIFMPSIEGGGVEKNLFLVSNFLIKKFKKVSLITISKNYKKKYFPPESYVKLLNKRFSPYCSVATWYFLRSIDPEPIQY